MSIEQATAADLRTLADLADTHPPLGREIAAAVRRLTAVIPGGSGVTIGDFAAPFTLAGATEIATGVADTWWTARAWRLPAGAVTLTITAMRAV